MDKLTPIITLFTIFCISSILCLALSQEAQAQEDLIEDPPLCETVMGGCHKNQTVRLCSDPEGHLCGPCRTNICECLCDAGESSQEDFGESGQRDTDGQLSTEDCIWLWWCHRHRPPEQDANLDQLIDDILGRIEL